MIYYRKKGKGRKKRSVSGYNRKDGTKVKGYMRSKVKGRKRKVKRKG